MLLTLPGNPESWQNGIISMQGETRHPLPRYYHLPKEWLKEQNTLVIFEETDALPAGVRIVQQ